MRKSYSRIMVLLLVTIIVVTSCFKSKNEPIVTEEEKNTISNQEEENTVEEEKTIEKDHDIDEAEEELIVSDITGPIEGEIELYHQLVGGVFYTSMDMAKTDKEKEFAILRKETIDNFNNSIIDVFEECYELNRKGLEHYETVLLKYIDRVEVERDTYTEVLQEITTGMLKYKTSINALQEETNWYLENEPEDEALKAVIDGYIFENIQELFVQTDEYLQWLVISRDYLFVILGEMDSENAKSLIVVTDKIYVGEIVEAYKKMFIHYVFISNVYTYIASGDYYMSQNNLIKTGEMLSELEKTEDVLMAEGVYNNMVSNSTKPDYLIEPVNNNDTRSSFRTPFVITVYADEMNHEDRAIEVLLMIDKITDKVVVENNRNIEKIIGNEIANQHSNRDYIIQRITETLLTSPSPNTIMNDSKVSSRIEICTEVLEEANIPIVTSMEAMEEEGERQEAKRKIAEKLAGGQLLLSFASFSGYETQYGLIINQFVNVLKERGGNFDRDQFQTLETLLRNDLEEILGDEKEAFVNTFINTEAEELVEMFMNWKDKSLNSDDLKFDVKTLISLLDEMGIEVEDIEDEEEQEDEPEEAQEETQEGESEVEEEDLIEIVMPLFEDDNEVAILYIEQAIDGMDVQMTTNGDGSITYLVSKETQLAIVDRCKKQIDETIMLILQDENAELLKVLEINESYNELTMVTETPSEDEETFMIEIAKAMVVVAIYTECSIMQTFEGVDADHIVFGAYVNGEYVSFE